MTGWIIYCEENRSKNDWFINQLVSYAKARNVDLRLILAHKLAFGVSKEKPSVFYDGKKELLPDFVINRSIFPVLSLYLEKMNIRVFNSYKVSDICNDKRKTHLYFKDLPMMETYFYDKRFFDGNVYLKFPCVVKPADGHGGEGVCLVNSEDELLNVVNTYKTNDFLLQRAASCMGRDLRVYVMGKNIIGAALRSSDDDFRSNFSLGGNAEIYKLSKEEENLVLKVIEKIDADYIGIDFIFDKGKMVLNEIEDVVGARMLYSLTKLSVHEMYIDYIIGVMENKNA